MTILIFSGLGDSHALSVNAALDFCKKDKFRLLADVFPEGLQLNVEFDGSQDVPLVNVDGVAFGNVETVWLRRRISPKNISSDINAEDKNIALQEADEFWKAMLYGCFGSARWINDVKTKLSANSKIYQINMARLAGLKAPKTLFSNNPNEIRKFVKNVGRSVFKSFSAVSWVENGNIVAAYTNEVDLNDLADDTILRNSPGIFQERVDPLYEARIICMGNQIIAAKIKASRDGVDAQDWRLGYYGKLQVSPLDLDMNFKERILKFMNIMGLQFGALDFILGKNGEWYFLEVNESGQFLWLESYNPDLKLLRPFCQFLSSDRDLPDFSYAEIWKSFGLSEKLRMEMEKVKLVSM